MPTATLHSALTDAATVLQTANPEQAVVICDELLNSYPEAVRVLRLRADALEAMGDIHRAANDYERVLEVSPTDVAAMLSLSRALSATDRREEARLIARQALDYEPHNADLRLIAGMSDRALDDTEAHAAGAIAQAQAQFQMGRTMSALSTLRRIAARSPGRTDVRVVLAEMLWRSGGKIAASELCQGILDEQPDCLRAHALMAAIWDRVGATQIRQTHLRALDRLDPDHRETRAWLSAAAPVDVVDVPAFAPRGPAVDDADLDAPDHDDFISSLIASASPIAPARSAPEPAKGDTEDVVLPFDTLEWKQKQADLIDQENLDNDGLTLPSWMTTLADKSVPPAPPPNRHPLPAFLEEQRAARSAGDIEEFSAAASSHPATATTTSLNLEEPADSSMDATGARVLSGSGLVAARLTDQKADSTEGAVLEEDLDGDSDIDIDVPAETDTDDAIDIDINIDKEDQQGQKDEIQIDDGADDLLVNHDGDDLDVLEEADDLETDELAAASEAMAAPRGPASAHAADSSDVELNDIDDIDDIVIASDAEASSGQPTGAAATDESGNEAEAVLSAGAAIGRTKTEPGTVVIAPSDHANAPGEHLADEDGAAIDLELRRRTPPWNQPGDADPEPDLAMVDHPDGPVIQAPPLEWFSADAEAAPAAGRANKAGGPNRRVVVVDGEPIEWAPLDQAAPLGTPPADRDDLKINTPKQRAPRPRSGGTGGRPNWNQVLADARMAASQQRWPEALAHYERLIQVGKQVDAVLGDLERLNTADPNPGKDLFRLIGMAHTSNGNIPAALEAYRKAMP